MRLALTSPVFTALLVASSSLLGGCLASGADLDDHDPDARAGGLPASNGKADGWGEATPDFSVDATLLEGDAQRCQFQIIPAGPSFTLSFDRSLEAVTTAAGDVDEVRCRIGVSLAMPANAGVYFEHMLNELSAGAVVGDESSGSVHVTFELDGRPVGTLEKSWHGQEESSAYEPIAGEPISVPAPYSKAAQCDEGQAFNPNLVVDVVVRAEGNTIAGADAIDVRFTDLPCGDDPLAAGFSCAGEKCATNRAACNGTSNGPENTCLTAFWSVLNQCGGDFTDEACVQAKIESAIERCKSAACPPEDTACAEQCGDASAFAQFSQCLVDSGCAPLFSSR